MSMVAMRAPTRALCRLPTAARTVVASINDVAAWMPRAEV